MLHIAAYYGHVEEAKLLIEAGANVHDKNTVYKYYNTLCNIALYNEKGSDGC